MNQTTSHPTQQLHYTPIIANLFEPLEKTIHEKFLPALVGRRITEIERQIFALPVKLGGMGIYNPTLTSDPEFEASTKITTDLTEIICRQEKDLTNYSKERVTTAIKTVKAAKERKQKGDYKQSMTW